MITVLSVPSGHAYVQSLGLQGDGVFRLPDPTTPWWPHPALEPSYVQEVRADVYHLHFGYDDRTPAQLRGLLAALTTAGLPLVLTVHDLRNPHQHDPAQHEAALDVLIPAAAAVLTLTDGAAAEILARWGRQAVVVPHPHVVPLDRESTRTPHDAFVVGVHLKSLRANTDWTLLSALTNLPGITLRIDLHAEVLHPLHPRHDPALLAWLNETGIDVHVHGSLADEAFYGYLEELDVSVLPYRFGTHSGWLETCSDLGTTVVAPDCGYLQEQQPCLTFATGDRGSLAAAVVRASAERPVWQADRAQRAAQRAEIAALHRDVYRQVTAA